ncbi:response regulator [Cohnella sp. AR92]|uniref:response regulator n=1 Tax=Cohnella sp. AR92 TaxID=648716 RepID=UPI001315A2FC|nr:response regulator [Cohnella sp. AR92]
MSKYQTALIETLHKQFETWFEDIEDRPSIAAEEVARFLHTVKGTAGTIGMPELSETAALLMEETELTEMAGEWPAEKLGAYLYPLMRICYEFSQGKDGMQAHPIASDLDIPMDQPLVLILDDDVTMLRYLKEELEANGFFVIATVRPDHAIHYFHDLMPDCFILDLMIPDIDGFQVMETLGSRMRSRFVPTTVISVNDDKETRLKAFRMGADDFLSKPLDMEELLVRLGRQLRRKEQVDRLLFVDELTGALNRKSFAGAYRRLCVEKQRTEANFTLAVIDLDRFKQVNDKHGHSTGDKVLSRFADYVREHTRASDDLFRFGGEEFVLLLPHTRENEAVHLLERILEQFGQVEFGSEECPLRVTFSAGVVEVSDTNPDRYEDWIEAADRALYRAKEDGRSRIEIGSIGYLTLERSKKLNVAVVDDDVIIRTLLAELLSKSLDGSVCADIKAFRDGRSFLADKRHSDRNPYLVILDGMMPDLDGLEVLAELRANPDSDRYSVIMLTGRAGSDDINRALKLGADDYLTKPFRIQELDIRIRRLLRRFR